MKVRPIRLELTDEQKSYFKSTTKSRYQLTIGKSYLVYTIEFVPGSVTDFTLYRLLDDGTKFIPVPACLMEIVDPRVSRYWRASHNPKNFSLSLEPQEFIDDPWLTEAILDREPEALLKFEEIRKRLEAESLQLI